MEALLNSQIGKIASEEIETKKSGYYHFDLNNEISETEAAICGGDMSVLIDAHPEKTLSVFEALNHSYFKSNSRDFSYC